MFPRFVGQKAKLTLIAVFVLIIASGCCIGPGYQGVEGLYLYDDGKVVADSSPDFYSRDGGLTWRKDESSDELTLLQSASLVTVTPRGTYRIEGADVYRVRDGESERVYSAAYLTKGSNWWAQEHSLDYPQCTDITEEPTGILYDPSSDNVILGMGWVGAVIGQPDGKWIEVGVGPYTPTDLSFTSKLRMMFQVGRWVQNFWAALLIALTSVALITCFPRSLKRFWVAAAVCVGYAIGAPVALYLSAWIGLWFFVAALIAPILGPLVLMVALSREHTVIRGFGMAYCAVALFLSLLLVPYVHLDGFHGLLFWIVGFLAVTVLALTLPPRAHLILGAKYSVAIYLALVGATVLWLANVEGLLPLGRWLFVLIPLPVIAILAFHMRRASEEQDNYVTLQYS